MLGGSGNGEQIAANKVPGARCALAWSTETAALARQAGKRDGDATPHGLVLPKQTGCGLPRVRQRNPSRLRQLASLTDDGRRWPKCRVRRPVAWLPAQQREDVLRSASADVATATMFDPAIDLAGVVDLPFHELQHGR